MFAKQWGILHGLNSVPAFYCIVLSEGLREGILNLNLPAVDDVILRSSCDYLNMNCQVFFCSYYTSHTVCLVTSLSIKIRRGNKVTRHYVVLLAVNATHTSFYVCSRCSTTYVTFINLLDPCQRFPSASSSWSLMSEPFVDTCTVAQFLLQQMCLCAQFMACE